MVRKVVCFFAVFLVFALPVLAVEADFEEGDVSSAQSVVSDSESVQSDSVSVTVDTSSLEEAISDLQDSVNQIAENEESLSQAVDDLTDSLTADDDDVADFVDDELVDDESATLDDILLAISETNDILLSVSSVTDVYDGNISSTVLAYFDRVVSKLPVNVHYVLVRSSQYVYTLYYGDDLSLDGYVFSGTGLNWVMLDTSTSNNQSVYDLSWGESVDISFDCSGLCVYSDLGLYPVLSADSFVFVWLILFVLVVLCLCLFIRPWLATTYRWSSSAFGGVTSV